MNKVFSSFVFFGSMVAACSSGGPTGEAPAGTGHLRIEMACGAGADCPAGFSCETETENGATKSFCESDDEVKADGTGAQCPAGFEREEEHGTTVCKPHGGDDHGSGGADNDGDSANSGPGSQEDGRDAAAGSDDGAGHDGTGGDDGAGHDGAGGHDDGGGHDGQAGSDDGSGRDGNSGHG